MAEGVTMSGYWDDHEEVENAAEHAHHDRSSSEQLDAFHDHMAQFGPSDDRDDAMAQDQAFQDEMNRD